MIDSLQFSALKTEFQKIKNSYPSEYHKYLHIRTIENFLLHAPGFSVNHHRELIYTNISAYLNYIDSGNVDSVVKSLEGFNNYLKPLVSIYSDVAKFHVSFKSWMIILMSIPVIIVFYLIKADFYYYAIPLFIIAFLLFRQMYFARENRTYGFMY